MPYLLIGMTIVDELLYLSSVIVEYMNSSVDSLEDFIYFMDKASETALRDAAEIDVIDELSVV